MILDLDFSLGEGYKSTSQKIRNITETWTVQNIFCPNCGFEVQKYENNRAVADFFCPNCQEQFEQKARNGHFFGKVLAGQYDKLIERLNSTEKPNFFFMEYADASVKNFFVMSKSFITPGVVERRKPLAETAHRSGWVGSNILLPKSGQIFYVRDGQISPKDKVLAEWKKREFIREIHDESSKGWAIDTMNIMSEIHKNVFTLAEVYEYEPMLAKLHPENYHIRDKIRQQLQVLRDKKFIDFIGSGVYRKN